MGLQNSQSDPVKKVLVTGGARSGKSAYAEQLLAGLDVDYVATAARRPEDPEWEQRIVAHQARRPANWVTIETLDIASVLAEKSAKPVMVDSIGVWLTRTIDDLDGWANPLAAQGELSKRMAALAKAYAQTSRMVVSVTDECGLGIVPESASVRFFRDQLGTINQLLASCCNQVVLCVAGIGVTIKG